MTVTCPRCGHCFDDSAKTRRCEAIRLFADGKTIQQIAAELAVSDQIARNLVRRGIIDKFGRDAAPNLNGKRQDYWRECLREETIKPQPREPLPPPNDIWYLPLPPGTESALRENGIHTAQQIINAANDANNRLMQIKGIGRIKAKRLLEEANYLLANPPA